MRSSCDSDGGRQGAAYSLEGCSWLQFFIWLEVLASTVVIGAIAVVLYFLVRRQEFFRRWRYMATAFAYGIGAAGVLLIVPLGYTLLGPQSIRGTPVSPTSLVNYPSDLFGSVVPTSEWLTTNGLTSLANTTVSLCHGTLRGYSHASHPRGIRHIPPATADDLVRGCDGNYLFRHLPWRHTFGSKATKRQSLFLSKCLRIFRWFKASCRPASPSIPISLRQRCSQSGSTRSICASPGEAPSTDSREMADRFGGWSLDCPDRSRRAPFGAGSNGADDTDRRPPFFSTSAVDVIPQDGVVLAYPYPDFSGPSIFYQTTHDIMLDQAVSGMRFKLIGGYGWFPSPTGEHGTTSPTTLEPNDVQELFDSAYYGSTAPEGERGP